MEIYIIRHTKVAIAKDICYGQSNVPLADTFLEEVAQFKTALPNNFEGVFCSPLDRCKDLAKALEYQNIILEGALMEMNFGEWEGKKWNDLDQEKINEWMQDFVNIKTPDGESLTNLFGRVKSFLDSLRHQQMKSVLLITHAGVIRCIWAYLLEIPLQNIFKIPVGHHEIFICKLAPDSLTDSIKRTK